MRLRPLASALLLLGVASCTSSGSLGTRVTSAPLAGAPPEVMAPVWSAREAVEVARETWKNARARTRSAEKGVDLARRELGVVTDEVDQARRDAAVASAEGAAEAQLQERRYQSLLASAEIARLGLALAKREHDVSDLRELLALEEAGLAQAHLDFVTAKAVDGLDLPPKAAVPVSDLRAAARHQALEVERVNQRLSAARVVMQRAREAHETAIDASRPRR